MTQYIVLHYGPNNTYYFGPWPTREEAVAWGRDNCNYSWDVKEITTIVSATEDE